MRCDISQRLGLSFDAGTYFAALRTRSAGRVLLAAEEVTSTQTIIQDNTISVPDGTLCTATRQVSGRGTCGSTQACCSQTCMLHLTARLAGRGGNSWVSPDGCLMFSLCLHLEIEGEQSSLHTAAPFPVSSSLRSICATGTSVPYVQYLVSMAIVQAVKSQAAQQLQVDFRNSCLFARMACMSPSAPAISQGKQLDVRIKWPNDVYGSGQKLAGVLTHSSYRSRVFRLTIGSGINVANQQPSICIDDLLRQQHPQAQSMSKEVCHTHMAREHQQTQADLQDITLCPVSRLV